MKAHIYLYRNEYLLVGAYSSIFVAIIISLTFIKSKKLKNLLILSMFIVLLFSSCGLQQNLSASSKLSEGMTKSEVEAIMGLPIKSDFYKKVDEWHYCKTGQTSDEFIALFFYDGKLIAKKNYTVTAADTQGIYGSCEKFIKMGNYREPDIVTEIRLR